MPDLIVERRDRVLYLTLNRPDRLNALSDSIIAGLLSELNHAASDSEIGAVVVTGAGRGFCAGGDISRMRDRNEAADKASTGEGEAPTLEQRVATLFRSEQVSLLLNEMPKVTIAAINGPAAGAGLSIALACDLRLASDQARLGTAFARVGFSGDFGGSYTLTQLVGTAKARELYFSAEMLNAEDALRIGLVSRVIPSGVFAVEVHAYAKKIANGPTVAYSYMKANLNYALYGDFRTALQREAYSQNLTGQTRDHKEAVKAFLEKREPKFEGR